MEVLKKVAGGMRSGFVLPFSLVMTFIVLIMVGAAANYCTQTMRASEIYLLRSRARLAAQSTIEQAKLVIKDSCDDNQQGIADEGGAGFDQAIANLVVGKIKDSERMTRFLDEMRWSEAHRGDSDTTVTLGTRSDAANGVHAIYATAEVRGAGRKEAVTLEEDIRVLRQAANIFHYAYFANGDGHLIGLGSGTSQRLTVNGDVRANGDFYLSGVNVNGFVYSQGEVNLADETDKKLKAWWNERFVTTRTADSYNSNFRTVNTKHNIKTKYDCRVRPTDPIATGVPWEGGFRGAHDYTQDKSGNWLARLISAIFEAIRRAMQNGNQYDNGEIAITKDVRNTVKTELEDYEAEPKGQIIKEKVSKLPMPRIVADEEPETDNDKHLKFYREGYAATARTPKGKTGGWLICSNAYLNARGEPERFSARILLEKPARTETVQDVVHHGEETKPGEVIRQGSRVVEALKPNSLLVYGCLTDDEYRAKVAASPDEKNNWYQLRGDHSNADDGPVGAFASGFAGTVPAGQPHAGEKLFFDKKSFDDLLRTNFNLRADNVRVKFNEDGWREVNATYKSETKRRGAKVISTDSVQQYRYSNSYELLWTSASDGYLAGSGNYVVGSMVRSILSDYTKYSGITETAVLNALLGSGWKTCKSGYYSQLSALTLSSLDVQLIQYYDNWKTERYEVRSGSNFKDWEESYSVYQYNGVYYSAEPVGMIEINTNEYDAAKITITFNPISKSTATKTTKTYQKILETRLVRLYNKSTGWRDSTLNGYGNSQTGSRFSGKCFKKEDMDKKAEYFGKKYESSLETEIKGYFSGGNGGWSAYNKKYSGTSGYIAIRIVGTFYEETGAVEYEVKYEYLSDSEAGGIDDKDTEDTVLDVYSVPVYSYVDYDPFRQYPDISGNNWYLIKGADDNFNNKVINKGEGVKEAGDYYDGRFGLTAAEVVAAVGKYFDQTNHKWSQITRGNRSNDPSGYLVVKVLMEMTSGKPSHKVVCDYSRTKLIGGDIDVETFTESETTYLGKVPNDCIPVYDYVDDATYRAKSSWAKQYWQATTGSDGCLSTKAHGFFMMRDLNRIADLKKDARLSLTADGVKEAIVDQEDATGYTWSTANNFAYHLSANPKGYINVKVNPEHVIEISYNHLSVASGEVHKPDTVIPEWDEEVERKVEYPAETKTVTRELRGIFVKQGYKIIADDSFIPPDWTNPLHVDPEDLKLWEGHPLTASSTTADLRPFREDGDFKCNAKTDNGDKAADKGAVILIGTWDFPILIDGPVVFESDVLIRGFVMGNGTIYSGRNIHIIGDIHYKNAPYWPYDGGALPDTKGKDLLRLVARGSIVIGNYARNPVTDQCVDEVWGKLLSENYINGLRNSHDGMGDGNYRYVKMDYTDYDRTGGGVYKIKYDHTLKKLDRERAKYYESVVGDYVFLSRNDQADANKPASGLSGVNAPLCDCRLSQHWDFNFGVDEYRTAVANMGRDPIEYASYQSTVIQDYVNKNAWSLSDRIGTAAIPGRSYWDYLWKQKGLDFRNFARDNYYPKSSTTPRLNAIQHIDAVLYACEGLYGAMGEQSTPCVINGAVIANEEALLPFVRMRRTLFGASRAEGHSFTINWDIRLNRQSEDAQRNLECDGDIFKQPMWGSSEDSTDIGELIRLHWMQVPNEFNPEYNATP